MNFKLVNMVNLSVFTKQHAKLQQKTELCKY